MKRIVKIEILPIILVFFSIYPVCIFSQSDFKKKLNHADELMKKENFEDALEILIDLNKEEDAKTNNEVIYKMGVCYLNSNIHKSKAIPYLEKFRNNNPQHTLSLFLLARAYQFSGKWDEAINKFEEYLKIRKSDDPVLPEEVKLHIQHCMNARELTQHPLDVYFFNLGDEINSPYADYYPFVDEKENFMLFNSKRPVNEKTEKNANGQYIPAIYVSKVANGKYLPASFTGTPICPENSGNEIIGMNATGDVVLIMKNENGKVRLFKSVMNRQGEFGKLEPLPDKVNESGDVIAACINREGDEIYFASDRKGGVGGTDIYVCRRLPSGKWSDAQNLGKEINTPFDEDFPNLSPDDNTLYFSSKGYSSIGGYDIFKATRDPKTRQFSGIKNLGYPVNTVYDDMNFRISANGKYGYVASYRGDTKGDLDIYRITFNEVEDDYTVLIGNIQSKQNEDINYGNVFISVYNVITNDLVGTYVPNPALGRFIMILPPGKYNMECEVTGYKPIKKTFEILDKSSYQKEINTTLVLEKQ